ncbi:MAG TPA: enoyl-CoA hydratase/isomerase family protein [Acidimicrobiales bacterium]|nr:enoyl-CoA hydratase/isomerase family protein [Acidimicrobiales bacterium]
MSGTDELVITRGEQHAVLTLNRPDRRNALSVSLRDAVSDALDDLAGDESVKCAVITGAGPVFSAGFDLKEFDRAASDAEFNRALWASSDRFHRTVLTFALPLVAAVNGPAIAGGFDLAVMCDIRVVADTARFSHPERSFGDVVYGPLAELVGGAVARDLTMGGRELSAQDSLDVHLVSAVVGPDNLTAAAAGIVERICVSPRDVLLRTKAKALRRAGFDPAGPTLDL